MVPAHADSGVKPTAWYNAHGVFEQPFTGTRPCRQWRKTDCMVRRAMAYYAVLLVPAHADSGVKPTAWYNAHGVFEQVNWYPPMQTAA